MLFPALQIETINNGFQVDQGVYVFKLVQVTNEECHDDFRSLRAMLVWTSNSCSGISCGVPIHSQVTKHAFKEKTTKYINSINCIVAHLDKNRKLRFGFLSR